VPAQRFLLALILPVIVGLIGCGLFEPREAETPTQSGSNVKPATQPDVAITNLQNAIATKNLDNYMACFTNPQLSNRGFTFNPSGPALAQYSGELSAWDWEKERSYMANLISNTQGTAYSGLTLTRTSLLVTSDSVVYAYRYTLTFYHNGRVISDSSATGNLQFTLGTVNGIWSIYRWIDDPLTPSSTAATWSSFKGAFSQH
jgi:hypothetical protein